MPCPPCRTLFPWQKDTIGNGPQVGCWMSGWGSGARFSTLAPARSLGKTQASPDMQAACGEGHVRRALLGTAVSKRFLVSCGHRSGTQSSTTTPEADVLWMLSSSASPREPQVEGVAEARHQRQATHWSGFGWCCCNVKNSSLRRWVIWHATHFPPHVKVLAKEGTCLDTRLSAPGRHHHALCGAFL